MEQSFLEYLSTNNSALVEQTVAHIRIVATSVVLAVLIGVPLGVVAHRNTVLRELILATSNFFLTIPSLALFALLIPFVGIGDTAPVIALTMYALLPIVRNTYSGISGVDRSIVESAKGMGLGPLGRLWRIELPLAWPVIITGMRVATLLNVGIAAIAVLVGGNGLGEEIFRGIRSLGSVFATNSILGGTLYIIVVAAAFDLLFLLLARMTTSQGIR